MTYNKAPIVRWDITSRCNFHCNHCYASSLYRENMDELSFHEIKQIINNMKEPGVDSIAFYGGEPLLREDLKNIIEYCNKNNIKSYVVTNGLILDKVIDDLIDTGVDGIAVSIDGSSNKTFKKIRNNNSFDKILTNFKILKEKGVRSRVINTVLMKENINELEEFIKLAIKVSATRINFDLLAQEGSAKNSIYCTSLSPAKYIKNIDNLYLYLTKNRIPIDLVNIAIFPPTLIKYINKRHKVNISINKSYPVLSCSNIFVDSAGMAYICKGMHPKYGLKKTDKPVKGLNLLKKPLIDLYNTDSFKDLFNKTTYSKMSENLPYCKSCSYFMEECSPCYISSDEYKEEAEYCTDFPVSKICKIVNKK